MDTEPDSDFPSIPVDDEARRSFWRQHIEAWRQTDLSQREYARQHGLPSVRFTYWKTKFNPTTAVDQSAFVSVRVASVSPVRLIHPCGVVVECPVGTDIQWLQSLLGLVVAS